MHEKIRGYRQPPGPHQYVRCGLRRDAGKSSPVRRAL